MKRHPRTRSLSRILPSVFQGQRLPSFIFATLAIILFLFSVVKPDNMQSVRAGVTDAFVPLLVTINKPIQGVADYTRAISGLAALQAENTRLAQENARLREWYQRAVVLQSENESLQSLLNVKLPAQHNFVTARIIADSGNTYAHTVLVLAGTGTGVTKGQAVLSGEGLLGRVIHAGNRTSRILLLTDINARVPVMIEGGNVRAMLAGDGGYLPALIHLPPDRELQEGQRVITSGHGGLFPYGLPVGVVVKATGKAGWTVRPYADIDRTSHVRVVNALSDPRLQTEP